MKLTYLIISIFCLISGILVNLTTYLPPKGSSQANWLAKKPMEWELTLKEENSSHHSSSELKSETIKFIQGFYGIEYKKAHQYGKWMFVIFILSIVGFYRERKFTKKENNT